MYGTAAERQLCSHKAAINEESDCLFPQRRTYHNGERTDLMPTRQQLKSDCRIKKEAVFENGSLQRYSAFLSSIPRECVRHGAAIAAKATKYYFCMTIYHILLPLQRLFDKFPQIKRQLRAKTADRPYLKAVRCSERQRCFCNSGFYNSPSS